MAGESSRRETDGVETKLREGCSRGASSQASTTAVHAPPFLRNTRPDGLPQVQLPSVTKCAGGADLLTGTCGDAPTGSDVAVLDPRWPEGGNCGGV